MARIAQGNTRTGAIAFPAAAARSPLEATRYLLYHRAKEAPAMSASESRITRRAQHPGREEAALGGTLAVPGPLNATDRCDRCGAQAYVRILLRSRQDLLFCAHHYRQHAAALAEVAIAIQNETQRLTQGGWRGSRS